MDEGRNRAPVSDKPFEHGEIKWWHWVLSVGFILVLTLIAPRGKSPEFAHLSVGSISPSRIIAPFDFEVIKNPDELRSEREDASNSIPPILSENDTLEEYAVGRFAAFGLDIREFFNSLPKTWINTVSDSSETWSEKIGEPFLRGSRQISDKYGIHLNWEQWSFLLKLYLLNGNNKTFERYFNQIAPGIMRDVYSAGVFEKGFNAPVRSGRVIIVSGNEEVVIPVDSLILPHERLVILNESTRRNALTQALDSVSIALSSSIIDQFLPANLIYNNDETERRRETARNGVPLAKGFIKQDELIIDRHIKVTEEHLAKITSLAIKRAELSAERGGVRSLLPTVGQILLISLLTLFLMFGVAIAKQEVWMSWKKMLLLISVISFVLIFFRAVPLQFELSRHLLPSAFAALLLTILLGKSVAALGLVTLALGAGFLQGNDFQTATYALANGGVAIMSLRSLQARRDVVRTGIYLAGVSMFIFIGFYLVTYSGDDSFWQEIGMVTGMAFISPIIVLGTAPLIESLFGITTDLTLLELVDLNRPLLRELAIKSPGTYHHSLMVGSLAEAAGRAIGANSLLIRAGAYYHDIGKMDIREYFIENQETGSENIHDRLPPSESASIVIDHVKRGLELADRHGLPQEIKMFISEHHGKTKLAYFYSKAQRELGRNIDEKRFRYTGPNPQTRETAILMLADGIEAATRSLNHPSQQDLKEMVDKFVAVRLAEGDLEECPITLSEITSIKKAFLIVLLGIHHQRIQYPDSSNTAEIDWEREVKIDKAVVN